MTKLGLCGKHSQILKICQKSQSFFESIIRGHSNLEKNTFQSKKSTYPAPILLLKKEYAPSSCAKKSPRPVVFRAVEKVSAP